MSHYTPDILAFDLAPPLEYRGADAIRTSFEAWFATFQGPIRHEIRDLRVTTGDDVAFSHSLNRIGGKKADGEEFDIWVRATVCLRKIAGKWLVAHEHYSVPFYMEPPFKASLDLEP